MKCVFILFATLFALNAFAAEVVLTIVSGNEDVEAGVSSERSCSVWSNHKLVTEVEIYDLIEQAKKAPIDSLLVAPPPPSQNSLFMIDADGVTHLLTQLSSKGEWDFRMGEAVGKLLDIFNKACYGRWER